MALYTERRPAASGGIWERAARVQALEAALAAGHPADIATALQAAWDEMAAADLEPALAQVYGARLAGLDLGGAAGALAFRLALMTPDYEAAAQARQPADATEAFLQALARGTPGQVAAPTPLAAAVASGFAAEAAPLRAQALIDQKRLGEAILRAMALVSDGANGQLGDLSDGLALLRALSLEDTARRAALEILILDRRG